jgi:tricarballylate dehydrogenase
MAMDIGAGTAGQFDMVHAELVDPRAKAPHSVIWARTTGS